MAVITLTSNQIKQAAKEAFEETKFITGGKNASYIPFLDNVPSTLFGLSITLRNGETFNLGDTDYIFGVESISKVFTALLVMKEFGAQEILQKIGADATGLPFNSIFAILLENDCPSTPLVNAGAISACSMVEPKGESLKKWDAIVSNFESLCGSEVKVLPELYESESATNFNNRSIAWLLKTYGRIYDDPAMSLDLYTRQCSIGITSRQLSVCGATIADGGINPVTGQRIFPEELASKIVSLVATVGFYQKTGDWMYQTGVPAKSGVGGGILAVVPGVMGISTFSPPLDEAGNSFKGQALIKSLARKLNLGVFNGNSIQLKEN